MNNTKVFNLVMTRGDTLAFSFEVEGIDNLDEAYFTCKLNHDDDTYIFQKDLTDGISVVEAGKYRVRLAPADTEDIELGSYYYDLKIKKNGDAFTILKGVLDIEYNVTEE